MKRKKKKTALLIPFSGLKEGHHQFDFKIDAEFFEQYEHSPIKDAVADIEVDFERKKNLFELNIHFDGRIKSICDRCSDPVQVAVEGSEYLAVKFGEEEEDGDENILYISENEHDLDISDQVYQMINLRLPVKIEHEYIADCDPAMIEKLNEYSQDKQNEKKEEEIDPRWEALSKLKDN